MGNQKQQAEENRLPKKIARWLYLSKKKSIAALCILLFISILLGTRINELKFNYSFDSFFPQGDDDLEYYQQFIQEFGQFNDFLFVVIENDDPFEKDFINRLNVLKSELSKLTETESIVSPFELKGVQINPLGVNTYNLINSQNQQDKSFLEQLDLLGNFFGRDDHSVMLLLRHHEFNDKKLGDRYYENILKIITESGFINHVVSGKIQMQYDFTKKLENELGTLLTISLGVIIFILLILFRSIKGLVLPLLILILTLVWTMGMMAWTGKSIDVMVVMIPPILLIIALSDVIHFVHKYDQLREQGFYTMQAICQTILVIGKATFLTSATTAIGFISLIFIPIKPIKEFGLLTASGVLFAFIITFLALPALLTLFPSSVERKLHSNLSWQRILTKAYEGLLKHRIAVVLTLIILSVALTAGIGNLRLSTSLIVGLQRNEPELQKVAYFDDNFDGYKPFEFGIELSETSSLLSIHVVDKLVRLEKYLQKEYGVKHIQSPLNIIRELNAGLNGGARKYAVVPAGDDLNEISRYYYSPRLKESRNQVEAKESRLIRMIGRNRDLGSAYYHALNENLKDFLKNEINGNGFEARLTGASYLIDKTDQYVVSSLLKGLGFALVSVSFFILIFFRSIRLALFTLIPNLIPIAILFGLMGWFNIDLNISTAIIFTVALGIAIDDSIHFIARYKLESLSVSNNEAIKNAFTGTGKSILVTSLIIILGFSAFLSSGFSASYYLGFFIVLAAIIALVLDLCLLPILLRKRT